MKRCFRSGLLLAALLVSVAGLAVAAVAAEGPVAGASGGSLAGPVRVMSYNIRYDNPDDRPGWAQRQGPMLDQIRFTAPDILGVQEALPHMLTALAAGLPGYDHYGQGRDGRGADGGERGESTAIFYSRARFALVQAETQWCSATPDRPSKAEGAGSPRTITRLLLTDRSSGALYDVRNVHFDNVSDRARSDCARQVLAMPAAAGARLIVLGDFNSDAGGGAYRLLASAMADARRVSPVVFGPDGTFNDFDIRQTGPALDHILIGAGLAAVRFATLTDSIQGQVISDHFPVVADLQRQGE